MPESVRRKRGISAEKHRKPSENRVRQLATDLEAALRRETRERRRAESVARSQAQALTKTMELLSRAPSLPDFMGALLRTITSQCGGLWATFWALDERTGEPRRTWIAWRDRQLARMVEDFASAHRQSMKRLGAVYRESMLAEGVTQLVPCRDKRVSPLIRRFYRKIGATGALLVPLRLGRRTIGFLTLQRADASFESWQIAFMEAMGQQVALAFHLDRLSDARHAAESALESEQAARARDQELREINELFHFATREGGDRSTGVLRRALEGACRLLRGSWVCLWKHDDASSFAMPGFAGGPGRVAALPREESLAVARKCHAAHRARLAKWRKDRGLTVEVVRSPRIRALLQLMGAPVSGRALHLVRVPLCFDDESVGFLLVLAESPPPESAERRLAVKALAMQAALVLALGERSMIQRSAALAEERNRIARDLHDLLAQSFTGIVLQVEAAQAECAELPEDVRVRLEKIRLQAARSSEELRRTLAMLRPTALDHCKLPEALNRLARETEARSGVAVSFRNRAGDVPFTPRAEQHLLAIATESLQNALSHAQPTRIELALDLVGTDVVLKVVNDRRVAAGSVGKNSGAGHGHGLASLRERAAEIGAQFTFRPTRRRFRVEISAPLARLSEGAIA